jgi:hypothetical protein
VYTHDVDRMGNTIVGWNVIGGTSLGAPAWAALIALADQIRVANGKGTMDGATQTRPALLGLGANNYHDITVGFTGQDYAGNDVYADTGYDEITGMGSPIADVLVPNLAVAGGGQLPGGSLAGGGAQTGGFAQGGGTPGFRTSLGLGATDAAPSGSALASGPGTLSRSLVAAAPATSPSSPVLQAAATAQPAVAIVAMSLTTVQSAPAPSSSALSATSSSVASIDYLLANDLLSRWDVSQVDVPAPATTPHRPRPVKVQMRAASRSSSITVGAHQNQSAVRRLGRGQDLSQHALKGVVVAGWSFDGGRPTDSNPAAPSTTGAVGSRAHGLTNVRSRGTRPS